MSLPVQIHQRSFHKEPANQEPKQPNVVGKYDTIETAYFHYENATATPELQMQH